MTPDESGMLNATTTPKADIAKTPITTDTIPDRVLILFKRNMVPP